MKKFSEVLQKYCEAKSKTISPRSLDIYKGLVWLYERFGDDFSLSKADVYAGGNTQDRQRRIAYVGTRVNALIDSLQRNGYSPASQSGVLSFLRSAAKWLEDTEGVKIAINASNVSIRRKGQDVKVVIPTSVVDAFLSLDAGSFTGEDRFVLAWAQFNLRGAFRIGDLISMPIPTSTTVKIRAQKTGAITVTEIPVTLLQLLQAGKPVCLSGKLDKAHAGRVYAQAVARLFRDNIPESHEVIAVAEYDSHGKRTETQMAIYETITAHSLRRSGLSWYAAKGLDRLSLSKISGHTPGSRTLEKYYLSVDENLLVERIRKIGF